MPHLLHPNFDFEHQLTSDRNWQTPAKLQRVNAHWAHQMLSLADPGDSLWLPEWQNLNLPEENHPLLDACESAGVKLVSTPTETPKELRFVPWGWSPAVINRACHHPFLFCEHPDISIVRWLNSRLTSFVLEQEWECSPGGMHIVRQLTELEAILASLEADQQWVLKAEFGMSGRERWIGRGSQLDDQAIAWCRKRLRGESPLIFEPWLKRHEEMSFHFHLAPGRSVRFLGFTELQTDHFGRYLSNTNPHDEQAEQILASWKRSMETTSRLAQMAAERGYFGPLSVDAMRYRTDDGSIHERPLQDINARYTMGRCEWERGQRKTPNSLLNRNPESSQS